MTFNQGGVLQVLLVVATEKDTEFARQSHHLAYRDVVERQFGSWDDALQNTFFARDWNGRRFELIVCDGEPCGYAGIDELPTHFQVRELVVRPEFQGRRIGTWILNEVARRGAAKKVPVRLGVLQQNRALKLYRKLGFSEISRDATHVFMEKSC
jgi:ribosomal protein S18 acetylase RimI-like enzyme